MTAVAAEVDPRRKVSQVAAAVAIVAMAVLLATPSPLDASNGTGSLSAVVAIVLAFVVCERLVFHIEARNEAVSFSATDIPLAVGVVLLSPVALVGVRLVGGALGIILWRRQPLFKFVVNMTAFTVEVVVASLLFRTLVGIHPQTSLLTWLALALSMHVALTCGGLMVGAAISFYENDLSERLRREVTHSYLFYLPGALLGASTAASLLVEPWLIVVGLVPAPILWLVLSSHGSLMHSLDDLRHIHEFSSQVGQSNQLADIAETAVREIAHHLRAAHVELCVVDSNGVATAVSSIGRSGVLAGIDAGLLSAVDAPGQPVRVQPGDGSELGVELRLVGVHDAILVAIHHNQRLIATLLVADREGASEVFHSDDSDRLVPITQQLAVALAKGQLHVEIQHQATHDTLTGLPNRAFFEAWTEQWFSDNQASTLMLIDLDRFKEVNDTLGHHVGDQLLVEAAERIKACLAPDDTLARLGGDEFAIVTPLVDQAIVGLLAESISSELERPFELGDGAVAIAASIGMSRCPEHGKSRDQLLRRADLAMYEAKRLHTRSVVFREELDGSDSIRLALLGSLRDAIRDDGLDVHFQPKISTATNDVVGAEALARWTHPSEGPVGPDVFVPMAEQAGLIGELTSQILQRAIAAAASWTKTGNPIGVAVNISPQSLVNEDLPDTIAAHLREHNLAPRLLTLEITEASVMADTPRVANILDRLGELGINISVDDFGTGHSSLVNLRRMPVSEIKIDRGFISEMLLQPNDEVIVRSTVELGHNLGLNVVAEGVETGEVLDALRLMGCNVAQGFGISRPLPTETFARWLEGRSRSESGATLGHAAHSLGDNAAATTPDLR